MPGKQKNEIKQRDPSLAVPLAPEEIRAGDYVALLYTVYEILTGACGDSAWKPIKLQKVLALPSMWDETEPVRVCEVCLPFVIVENAVGDVSTIDVRRNRLARLNAGYGRRAMKRIRRQARKRRKKEKF